MAPGPLSSGRGCPSPHPTDSPWLLERDIAYLNHGSFGACPDPVLEAQRVWRERMEAQPVRFLGRELERHLDEARQRVAVFLKADPDGLAFVPNATTGVSTVLASLRFQPGDELLASDHEYNATLNALRAVAAATARGSSSSGSRSRSATRPRRSRPTFRP